MILSYVRSWGSIDRDVAVSDLPDFVVLSGPNGAGKSNLLDAIQSGAVVVDDIAPNGPQGQPQIRKFGIADFVSANESQQTAASYRDRWTNVLEPGPDLDRTGETGRDARGVAAARRATSEHARANTAGHH